MIPAVLVAAATQRNRVNHLVKHCLELDGTELVVLEGGDNSNAPYPHCNTNAFHQAAAAMRGRPFLWMEPDCIPQRKDWRARIEAEYRGIGKPILAPSDSNPPHDIASGICVYPGEAYWLFPKQFREKAWDAWMQVHLAPLIGRTPLIQHSYGVYDSAGDATPHRFPRDNKILRPEAVLFHRDRFQDLIPRDFSRKQKFCHSGDLGDVIAALPAIRALGGGDMALTFQLNGQRESLKGARFEAIRPLLEAQPYIGAVAWEDDPADVTHDFRGFRALPSQRHDNLAIRQARAVDAEISFEPWLSVPEIARNDRVIVARTLRYHNPFFPWPALTHHYRGQILFVGLPDEYENFTRRAVPGQKIDYHKTQDLLELAQLIAGCALFIGNQSAPFWIAAGLGVPLIQETWEYDQNSIVERANAIYTGTGPETRTLMYRIKNPVQDEIRYVTRAAFA